jgi:PAS domain S-box-containing protein
MSIRSCRASYWGVALLLGCLASLGVAHNGAVALVYPIDDITIDGNLEDWPDGMERYPISLVEYGDPIKDTDDFEGWFRMGYSETQNAVYVAIEVRDESHVVDVNVPSMWDQTDGCNVYIDVLHAEEESVADQFITYGYHLTQHASKPTVQWHWKRQDGLYCYEWRINVSAVGGNSSHLKALMSIGWDVAICDRDRDGSFSWVSWGRETFTFFTSEDGLPSDDIRSLAVDRYEQLWLGTSGGLCVYDGKTFTQYTVEDGLIDNRVQAVLEDTEGRIWMGTPLGVCVFDGRTISHFTREDGLSSNNVVCLLEDTSDRIWLGTTFTGICVYDGGTFTNLNTEDGLASNRIVSLLEDSSGHIWVSTRDGGLCQFDGTEFSSLGDEDDLLDRHVTALVEDNNSQIWTYHTERGLGYYNKHNLTQSAIQERFSSTTLLTGYEDREGNLWWGSTNGLIQYETAFSQLTGRDGDPFAESTYALLKDHLGRVWIGSDLGVTIYDKTGGGYLTEVPGLKDNRVRGLLEDSSNRCWVATAGSGVSVYNGQNDVRYDRTNGLLVNSVQCLLEDSGGRVWIGTNRGISIYDGKQFSQLTVEDGLADDAIRALLEDRNGRVWIATEYGLNIYDKGTMTRFTMENGLVSNNVTRLLEDSHDRIWIGTRDAGIGVYHDNTVTQFTRADGLVANHIQALFEDRFGHIWIGTATGGISRFDGKCFQSLTYDDGLPSNDVRCLTEDQQGAILIGTSNGVVRYHIHHTHPPVRLLDVVTDHRHGSVEQIRLPSTQSLLAFEYKGLSFKTHPSGMVYRYRLQGYDTEWQTTHSKRVEYHDVPRGRYTFELQAIDRDLSYSETIRVTVIVHRPYTLILFWSSLVTVAAMAVWQIRLIRLRSTRLRAARHELELRVAERTSELSEVNAMLTGEMTERKKVEKSLVESEQRFRKFFENEPEYCYMISLQGIILEANSAALSCLGYKKEELAGKPLRVIYAPECHAKVDRLFAAWSQKGDIRDEEMTIVTREGTRRTILLRASRILDERGETLYSVSVQRDITEQRRLERQEREYQRQIAHISRLTVAGELASGIAHELNQPLGAIATFSEGCRRLIDSGSTDSAEIHDALTQISDQAQRGGEIIRRMRRFVSKHELEFVMADLNAAVEEALRLIQITEADHGIDLLLDLAEKPLMARVDKIQIQQVVVNLVQNGIDSMHQLDSSERCLVVKTAMVGHSQVQFAVVDRGKGLPDNDTEKIYEAFFTTKTDGLGIGLSISQSIIEAHGGCIWGINNVDQGMTFGFNLPLIGAE